MPEKKRKRAAPQTPPLWERLVLFDYLTRQLGFESFDDIAKLLRDMPPDGGGDGSSRYCRALCAALPDDAAVTREFIEQADANIRRHTARIGKRRNGLEWKYFQWLTLLFAEMYLDRYWRDREGLLRALEQHRRARFVRNLTDGGAGQYKAGDLQKLSLWSATGSGKTLLLHANLLQFWHHRDKAGARDNFNRTILLVTNDGMASQHLRELRDSDIPGARFDKNATLLGKGTVEIVSIHQLAEKSGDKTVAVDLFESNNLVLVDEGHRGASGDKWLSMRDRLCRDGFSFEYSATFGQMPAEHLAVYAKNIFFDYSYRRFYNDGYGKEYRIFNLRDGAAVSDDNTRRYLVAGLLAYYRQLQVFADHPQTAREFLVQRPLWVFIGSKVNAVRMKKGKKVSDILEVLRFLRGFTASPQQARDDMHAVLTDDKLFTFSDVFNWAVMPDVSEMYDGILSLVFNCPGGGALRASRVEGADGEIALTLGGQLFGLVNIGDVSGFMKLCREADEEIVGDTVNFSDALFDKINDPDSRINVLVGAKKFIEGWNSWRVSAMGLLNVGRSEGAEALQMFGRGVRLRGFGGNLQRRAFAAGAPVKSEADTMEKLCIFGLKADFIKTFLEHLERERLPEKTEVRLEVLPTIRHLEKEKLKIIRVKHERDFKKEEFITVPKPGAAAAPRPVFLDWRPRLDVVDSQNDSAAAPLRAPHSIPDGIKKFFDRNRIYAMLQEFKADKKWHNLKLPRETVPMLLESECHWYQLNIAQSDTRFDKFAAVRHWEEIAAELMKKYLQACYLAAWARWEAKGRRFETLDNSHANIIGEYRAEVEKSQADLIKKLHGINEAVRNNDIPLAFSIGARGVSRSDCGRHLYRPLLHISGECRIEIRPHAATLNDGEYGFVRNLHEFFKGNGEFFQKRKLYLLRNLSRGRGVGFMEANNFHPDFLLWLLDGGLQHIAFIDPKGLRMYDKDNDKVNFYKTIVDAVEKPMREKDADNDNIRLHAFLVSQTPAAELNTAWSKHDTINDYAQRNIIFPEDESHIGKMLNKIISRQ